jgi:hypothetical protein
MAISVRQPPIQKIKVLCFLQLSKLVKESIFIFWMRGGLTEIWPFSSFLENGSLSLKLTTGQNWVNIANVCKYFTSRA